jgi:hypothetical protein
VRADKDFYSSVKSLFEGQQELHDQHKLALSSCSDSPSLSANGTQSESSSSGFDRGDSYPDESMLEAAQERMGTGMVRAHHALMQIIGSTGFGDMKAVVRMPSFAGPRAGEGEEGGAQAAREEAGGEQAGNKENTALQVPREPHDEPDQRPWLHAQLLELTNDGTLLYGELYSM